MNGGEFIFIVFIYFIIFLVYAVIGISCYKSKVPCTFWSGEKPPKIENTEDIIAYNHSHGIMWIAFASFIFLTSLLTYFTENIVLILICTMFPIVFGLIVMIFYHNKLYRKYVLNKM